MFRTGHCEAPKQPCHPERSEGSPDFTQRMGIASPFGLAMTATTALPPGDDIVRMTIMYNVS